MKQPVMERDRLIAMLSSFMAEHGTYYNLLKLGFFGSYARNQATASSDIDIVFVTSQPDLFMTSMMKQDLEALLGHQIDIVRLHSYLRPGFKAQLEKEAIYV